MRIGKKRNFALESQAAELASNEKLIHMEQKSDSGMVNVDLTLEPGKLDQLSSECRLTYDEYCDVINKIVEEEEAEWHDLRMKDQINITRDAIIQATMGKYAEEHLGIERSKYSAASIDYSKRYAENGQYIGEAIIMSFLYIPAMSASIGG